LVGKPFYDNALLGLAKSYQLTTEWHKTFPQDLD